MIDEILLQRRDEKTMKAYRLRGWGQEGRRVQKQKGSVQEPDLLAEKHIVIWEVRRKILFFFNFLIGIELYELQSLVCRGIYYFLGLKSEHQLRVMVSACGFKH